MSRIIKRSANTETNVIIYCRVSTDDQRKGTSVDVQEERLKAYCIFKGYNIINQPEFRDCKEDESAKDFEKRPVIQAILKYVRKHKGKVQKLLFLRWNRFSRDLFSATDVVKELLDLGVEPNAIEEELNFSSTSWPVLLGAYIGIAQSDNIARSKAIVDGIRGTMKRGKLTHKAPRGYKNVRVSKHNCYIVIDEEEAQFIRKAFIELSKGLVSANFVRKKYCPTYNKSTFFDIMRNPFYMGKIRVPAYQDEPEMLVEGQHEAIISEEIFNRVQSVIDSRRTTTPKLEKRINPDLFLRKFLICPICGRSITGATSKGNGGHYTYYYCCGTSKHVLVRADETIDLFTRFVSQLKPNPTVLKLYRTVLLDIHSDMKHGISLEIMKLREELSMKHDSIHQVEDLLVTDRNEACRYSKILERYENEVKDLEMRIKILEEGNHTKIKPKLDYVIPLINSIVTYIKDAPVCIKIKLIGSIFPEKIEFDGKTYRTKHVNMLVNVKGQQDNELGNEKAQKKETKNRGFRLGGV